RLLGQPARLEKARKVAALPELRDLELDGAGAGLPIAVPVAVTLRETRAALLAIASAGEGSNLKLHQPLAGKSEHVAKEIGVVTARPHMRLKVHLLVGHRCFSISGVEQPNHTGYRR